MPCAWTRPTEQLAQRAEEIADVSDDGLRLFLRRLVGEIINLLREEAAFVDVREESEVSPGPNDNAVCACAEQEGASFIVTLNRKDFP